ncbi:hypothetical protein K4S27_11095 [Staphylococcus epidermidis]|nr:hypothetical protein [Staphylococcus epidermidis]MCG2360222.1 hypothetical protein [Staphylococcus epidermidis]MCG2367176.1 hypothetical protein [Staphylococcus epidermidis]
MALNLDPNNVKKKVNEPKEEQTKEVSNSEVVPNSDRISVKDRIEEYSDTRMTSGRINETHTRSTFLVDDETLEKLQNLVDYMEASNGLNSKYHDNLTLKQIRDNRLLSKGFKSKVVNYALDTIIEQWESDEGLIPKVNKVRYKTTEGKYHRVFKFEENGDLYYLEQDNRGNEVKFLSTGKGFSESEINDLFVKKEEIAESQSNK